MQELPNFYSTWQAAEKLGVSVKRINQLVNNEWKELVYIVPGETRIAAFLIPKAVVEGHKTSLLHQANARGRGKGAKTLKKKK